MRANIILLVSLCFAGMARADVVSLNHNSGLAVNVWANGDWYLRAIEVDSADNPVGTLSAELMITLSGMAPFIDPVLTADIADGGGIWIYRSQTSGIQGGDMNVEVFKFVCSGGNAICDQANAGNIFLSDSLFAVDGNVLPVQLQSFEVE